MSESTTIDYVLTINTEMTYAELRKLEISLIRIMGYIQRFSGSPSIDAAFRKIQQLLIMIRSVQIAIRALEAASGPIGWLYALTTITGAGLTTASIMNDIGGH